MSLNGIIDFALGVMLGFGLGMAVAAALRLREAKP